MHAFTLLRNLAAVSIVILFLPSAALAQLTVDAATVDPTQATLDIALRDGGIFVGQVVDPHGKALVNQPIELHFAGECVARTQSDVNGVVAVQGLRGGEYQIATSSGSMPVRLWAANTAPPTAHAAALIVSDDTIVNGQAQCGDAIGGAPYRKSRQSGGIVQWMRGHPGIVAATVATAVVVPIALADDDNS